MFLKCSILLLSVCLAACVSGCGKKEKPQPAQAAQPDITQTQSAPNAPAPAVPSTSQTPSPSANSYDEVVTARSIDYLRGQVARKNWPQAQLALKQLEGHPLSPEQRQYVDSLKAQMPK